MAANPCTHPEKCAEEAGWMYNPHATGWNEVRGDHVNGRQAVGLFFRGALVFGNTVSDAGPVITFFRSAPQPTTRNSLGERK